MNSESNEEKKRLESEEAEAQETEAAADDLVDDEEVVEAPFDEEVLDEEPPSDDEESDDELAAQETAAEEEAEALRAELETVTQERDGYLDSLRRLKAEFENSRKRNEKERERITQSASERLIVALLPVLDNFDRALGAEGDIRGGVEATRDQLSSVLEQEGLLLIESDGEHFDPNLHEAVMSQPSEEHEEGTVLQTFERGYALNGRSIRPAKVIVSHQV